MDPAPTSFVAAGSYADAVRWLYGLRLHGLKLGLTTTRQLTDLCGRPQNRLRFIHVAGTNGKGSTCAMLEGIYRAAGLRVGLFTSPHLISFRERIQVNREWITEAEVTQGVDALQELILRLPTGSHPTFFEVVTVLALRYFADRECDLVIWETGMGGRLDATNIVTPLASLVTNIQYDHQKWLGTSRTEIAREKAGIIKPGAPVLTTAAESDALAVLREVAAEHGSPLEVVDPTVNSPGRLAVDWQVPLAGRHQRTNAHLALAAVETLQARIPVSSEAVRHGLASLTWLGRMQRVPRPSGGELLLDGAHNLAGMGALVDALKEIFPQPEAVWVFGVLGDKDWPAMCRLVAELARRVVLVPVRSERSVATAELAAALHDAPSSPVVEQMADVEAALESTQTEPLVVVAGSLHLVGEAVEWLGLLPAGQHSEHELNEWWFHQTELPPA